jgi:hypothetical protein
MFLQRRPLNKGVLNPVLKGYQVEVVVAVGTGVISTYDLGEFQLNGVPAGTYTLLTPEVASGKRQSSLITL